MRKVILSYATGTGRFGLADSIWPFRSGRFSLSRFSLSRFGLSRFGHGTFRCGRFGLGTFQSRHFCTQTTYYIRLFK